MVTIETNIFGAALAFATGAAIATLNYAFSRYLLTKRPSMYAGMQIVWQPVQIAYLGVLVLFGGYSPWDGLWLLVGGCLGITLPKFWFTYRLVKLNDSLHKKEGSSDG